MLGASIGDDIFMEHKNLNVQMSELSSSILVPTYLTTSVFFFVLAHFQP